MSEPTTPKLYPPYLIQRLKIKESVERQMLYPELPKDSRLTDFFRADYMGNAHFEYGAIFTAVDQLQPQMFGKSTILFPNEEMLTLCFFQPFTEQQISEYTEQVRKHIHEEKSAPYMEEETFLDKVYRKLLHPNEPALFSKEFYEEWLLRGLWWDFRNGILLCFEEKWVPNLRRLVEGSIEYRKRLIEEHRKSLLIEGDGFEPKINPLDAAFRDRQQAVVTVFLPKREIKYTVTPGTRRSLVRVARNGVKQEITVSKFFSDLINRNRYEVA